MKPARALALAMFAFVAAGSSLHASDKPNVLFIAIDDLRTELGCYGEEVIQSPSIDRLAESGVLFERAYCQLAVCNPSRVSIMTGLRPDSTRVWDLVTRFRETIPNAVTLPQHFRQHGYQTESYGKIFHNPWPDNQSWSRPHEWPKKSSLWSENATRKLAEYRVRSKSVGLPQDRIDRLRAQATEIVDTPDEEHIDGAIAKQAMEALERLAEQEEPFFLAAGFVRPHLPFVVPRKYWELYERNAIPLAENPFLPKDAPEFAMNTMYELRDYFDFNGTPSPDEGTLTEAQQRRLKHGYFASVSFIDALVGKLLTQLEQLGIADSTIVVLWSDHGWKLGEHNSWCKQTNHEIDARVPLIIRSPKAEANGQSCRALVELVDVYPTLCDLAGLPVPKPLEGQSMAPLLADPNQSLKQAAFSQFQRKHNGHLLMGYSMRTDRYRYIEWQDRETQKVVATELYDHKADPQENTNTAGLEENRERVAELRELMWATLPTPPKYEAPKAKRPQVVFRNSTDKPIDLFWIKPNGEDRPAGRIAPGESTTRGTTLGHRFRIHSPGGFTQVFEVTKQSQTFVINAQATAGQSAHRPNIVFCMADDWSWPHAGILGDPVVKTPNFDRVASEGVLFENAFVSTPSCTPSRLSILAGQHHWRLREGDSLGGSLREEYPVYTEMLQDAGYRIGRFGKGVWPSKHTFRNRDSFGEKYRSFDEFLKERKADEPFCYWHGGQDPHRPYELGIGVKSGMKLSEVRVPACLPDNETVRSDVADYLWEVQRFDGEVGQIISKLESIGELDNTIIVVSGDNGMPFPRCKATLYDQGTRVPLAIRWGEKTSGNRTISDFTNLCDLAPTFLHAAGIATPEQMTGRGLMPILESRDSGQIDPERTFALTGMERHVYSYPSRAIRTKDFLYIRNSNPQDWPTGEVEGQNPEYDFATMAWPKDEGAFSFNIDPSPAKQYLRLHRSQDEVKPFAQLSFGTHPEEELYDLSKDPDQLHNVANDPPYASAKQRLRKQLDAELIKSDDPRLAVDGYSTRTIEGCPVRISDRLMREQTDKTRKAIELLEQQLKTVVAVVPANALSRIRCVPIWLSPEYEGVKPTAEYHPNDGWLRKVGRHPELAECVELTNIDIFEKECRRMPMMLLHELAHAYHHQVLSFDHARIKAAYERAVASGSYDSVERNNGKTERAYGMNNHKEYFAESSEAFFGTNDFFPFNREQLKRHDPEMETLLGNLWASPNK
ncbi:sulfatase-like hydrolase/transferase [Novipirellula artificiosorum]|nr:sulfatase-like hydrolase/transferase [Novipirellula artificiosorum]